MLLSHLKVTGGLLTGGTADGGGIYHSAGALTLRHVTSRETGSHNGRRGSDRDRRRNLLERRVTVIHDSLIENNIAKTTQSGSGVVAAGGIYGRGT